MGVDIKFAIASSNALKDEVYRLRYEVYVDEFGYENRDEFPDGLEKDIYDEHSIHVVGLFNNKVMGTIRMIMNSSIGLPIDEIGGKSFYGEKPHPSKIIEVSRFAVSSSFRRRKEDRVYGVRSYIKKSEGGVLPEGGKSLLENERRVKPEIVSGLLKNLYQLTRQMELTHWYVMLEKRMYYMLKRMGYLFRQIGEPVEFHHAIRTPYLGIIEEMDEHFSQNKPEFFKMINDGLVLFDR